MVTAVNSTKATSMGSNKILVLSKVKIKAPSSSVAQNYTLALPDNQVAQNKYLSKILKLKLARFHILKILKDIMVNVNFPINISFDSLWSI